MVRFLAGGAASEVYRAAIEHEVGRELTSVARECSGQTSVHWSSLRERSNSHLPRARTDRVCMRVGMFFASIF